jgi:hypothetical protein
LLRQTLEWHLALAELHETGTSSELFLIEEQSIRNLVDVMNESIGCKGFPHAYFHHQLFKIAMDIEEESTGL